jgi:DNA-binding transcriptional MerR regulator
VADNSSEEKDALEPIEPTELLRRLKLTTGKAAQFAGVSRRQLTYWTDTGIVPSVEDDPEDGDDSSRRSYDFDALHRVLLINEALKSSPGLRRAAREVDRYLAARKGRAEELAASIEQQREEFLTEQADVLEELVRRFRELLPKTEDRGTVLELYEAIQWLERIADQVMSGDLLLEEDAGACLRLASLTEQAEAKLENASSES